MRIRARLRQRVVERRGMRRMDRDRGGDRKRGIGGEDRGARKRLRRGGEMEVLMLMQMQMQIKNKIKMANRILELIRGVRVRRFGIGFAGVFLAF